MAEYGFVVGNVFASLDDFLKSVDQYNIDYGVKLNRLKSNTFESAKVKKPAASQLQFYSLHYYCEFANINKNVEYTRKKKIKKTNCEMRVFLKATKDKFNYVVSRYVGEHNHIERSNTIQDDDKGRIHSNDADIAAHEVVQNSTSQHSNKDLKQEDELEPAETDPITIRTPSISTSSTPPTTPSTPTKSRLKKRKNYSDYNIKIQEKMFEKWVKITEEKEREKKQRHKEKMEVEKKKIELIRKLIEKRN